MTSVGWGKTVLSGSSEITRTNYTQYCFHVNFFLNYLVMLTVEHCSTKNVLVLSSLFPEQATGWIVNNINRVLDSSVDPKLALLAIY